MDSTELRDFLTKTAVNLWSGVLARAMTQSRIDEATRLSSVEQMDLEEGIERSRADLRQKSKPGEASGSGGSGEDDSEDIEMDNDGFRPPVDTLQTSFAWDDFLKAMEVQGASAAIIQGDAKEEELTSDTDSDAGGGVKLAGSGDESD